MDATAPGFASKPALTVVMCGADEESKSIFSLHFSVPLRGPPTVEY